MRGRFKLLGAERHQPKKKTHTYAQNTHMHAHTFAYTCWHERAHTHTHASKSGTSYTDMGRRLRARPDVKLCRPKFAYARIRCYLFGQIAQADARACSPSRTHHDFAYGQTGEHTHTPEQVVSVEGAHTHTRKHAKQKMINRI